MEYFIIIMILLIPFYISYRSKMKKIEKKLRILKGNMKGENTMSKLINNLIGQKCYIECEEDSFFSAFKSIECDVIDTDDEWIKIRFKDINSTIKTKIIRIETIKNIDLIV